MLKIYWWIVYRYSNYNSKWSWHRRLWGCQCTYSNVTMSWPKPRKHFTASFCIRSQQHPFRDQVVSLPLWFFSRFWGYVGTWCTKWLVWCEQHPWEVSHLLLVSMYIRFFPLGYFFVGLQFHGYRPKSMTGSSSRTPQLPVPLRTKFYLVEFLLWYAPIHPILMWKRGIRGSEICKDDRWQLRSGGRPIRSDG